MKQSESPFSNLILAKETPYQPDGQLNWLAGTPTHDEWTIGERQAARLPSQLESVVASAQENGIALPAVFVDFIRAPELHQHVRSVTDDYLKLPTRVLGFGGGYLVRFLADQQGCAYWYLYLNSNGSDHCVVMSYELFDLDQMDYEVEEIEARDFFFVAESFERFMCQYWISHEVRFARYDGTPLPVDARFMDIYSS